MSHSSDKLVRMSHVRTHLDAAALAHYRRRARELFEAGTQQPRRRAYAEVLHTQYPEEHAVLRYYCARRSLSGS